MPLITITSQCYERLLEPWIDNIRSEQQQLGVHESQILVPNHRLAGWLNQSLAQHCGISMNLRFRYIDSLFEGSDEGALSGHNAPASHNALMIEWAAWIWHGLQSGAFTAFRHLLQPHSATATPVQPMQLAWEYATQLQRLALHRPEWLQLWARNLTPPGLHTEQAQLQQRLYQYLLQMEAAPHPCLSDPRTAKSSAPRTPSLHCIGFWNFPPSVWQALETQSQDRTIYLYLPFPSSAFLVDLTRQSLREPQILDLDSTPNSTRYQLLSKLGQRARAMQMNLLDRELQGMEHFSEPISHPEATRLQLLQSHLLDPEQSPNLLRFHPFSEDHSIQVHSACNPRRQVEIAKACIHRCLTEIPDLKLEAIHVVAPDITPFLPAIREIFGGESDNPHLPYHIQRTSEAEESPGIRSVLELFTWLTTDWERPALLDWLATEPVRESFGFSLRDLELMDYWTRAAGIYRGNPAQETDADDLSWERGHSLLIQAYAGELQPDAIGFHAFAADPPYEHCETFYRWINLYDWLKQCAVALRSAPFSMEACCEVLTRIANRVIPPSREFEKQVLLSTLTRLSEQWPLSEDIELSVFRYLLRKSLPQLPPPQAMNRKSGIAFASIQAEELTPCRIRIFMGMNERDFPAADTQRSHDLLQLGNPQPGDPSLREDGRYWLLQSIHQTRDQWIVIYEGQDASGDTTPLLSPAVQAILDALPPLSDTPATEPVVPVIQHPRFAYDAECFGTDPWMHHTSGYDFAVAQALQQSGKSTTHTVSLPAANPSVTESLTIWDLARFFRHPNQFVCQQRLGMRFPDTFDDTPMHEPILWFGAGASYALRSHLLKAQAKGLSRSDQFTLIESHSAQLPGKLCELGFDAILQDLTGTRTLVDPDRLRLLDSLPIVATELEVMPGHQLACAALAEPLPSNAFLAAVHGSRKAEKHEIEAWVHLLAIWAQQAPEHRRSFALLHRDASLWLQPPANPESILRELFELYLKFGSGPVPFFPATSSYALRNPEKRNAIEQSSAWEGERGEKYDPCNEFLFRGVSPFGTQFDQLAHAILDPLSSNRIQNPM